MKKIICTAMLGFLTTGAALAGNVGVEKDPAYINIVNSVINDDYDVFLSGGQSAAIGDNVTDPMTASQLIAMYEKNELAANKKLKGKIVRIKSTASEIGENAVGQAFIKVDGKNQFQYVTLFVDGNDERVLNLGKGGKVDFSCVMDKYIMRTPVLKNCQFTNDLANERKEKMLSGLHGEKPTFRFHALLLAVYDLNKAELEKPCSNAGKDCLNTVAKVFNDDKKMDKVAERVNGIAGVKELPSLPF
ncbi:hypothetical protein KDV31_16635 [Citrobacter amalonaticus]|uniref:OB-fold protein n=1 Tax=Citrobacter amalonaticus TaxID=35703 RepID=UPI003338A600